MEQINVCQDVKAYQALSYVWGSDDKPFRALVRERNRDGKILGSIPLTTNLNNALRDLWNAKELQIKVLWIDQICIDQQGVEKNQQVSLMGQIYKNAARVITYLGPAIDGRLGLEERGVQLLQRLDKHFAPNYDNLATMGDLASAVDKRSLLPVKRLPDGIDELANEETWHWIASLCIGEWATRLWIVQEQLLNEVEIVMLRGSRLLSWSAVTIMAALFSLGLLPKTSVYKYWHSAPLADSFFNPLSISGAVFSLWCVRRKMEASRHGKRRKSGTIPKCLLSNLGYYEVLQCRDPRDRIFALLAISSDAKTELGIIPNYAEPAIYLFWRVSISIIQRHRYLDPLTSVCRLDNLSDPDYPSWSLNAPRPTRLRSANLRLGACSPHPYKNFDSLSERPRFKYAQDTVLEAKQRRARLPAVMVLKGRIIDSISFATAPFFPSKTALLGIPDTAQMESQLQCMHNFFAVLAIVRLTLENAAALCRTIVADPSVSLKTHRDSRSITEQTAYRFWCYFRYMANDLEKDAEAAGIDSGKRDEQCDCLIADLGALLSQTSLPQDNLSEEQVETAMWVLQNHLLPGRAFCITNKRRICSAMNVIQLGDVIAVFQGADRLFVLRPISNSFRYQLIGDAYVDGLMQGEAYRGVDPNRVDYDIELV